MKTLGWYPPQPISGGIECLDLDPSEWVMESKLDGIRVIWQRGKAYTRDGKPLSVQKGSKQVSEILKGITVTLDGEWCGGIYYVFDLPDSNLNLAKRRFDAWHLSEPNRRPLLNFVHQFGGHLTFRHWFNYGRALGWEGVVFKRKTSLYCKTSSPQPCRDWIKVRYADVPKTWKGVTNGQSEHHVA